VDICLLSGTSYLQESLNYIFAPSVQSQKLITKHMFISSEAKFNYNQLLNFAHSAFLKSGFPAHDSAMAAKVLLSADLRGIDSHGLARLSGYFRLHDKKRINANPDIRVIHQTPSTATIDADGALGLVAGPIAMHKAIEKAKSCGTGWVAVKGSNHFGIAGYHAMLALEQGMIGIAMTNASPLVAPTFSNERMLGTNPMAFAIPAGKEPPFVADFATTTAANGKLEILQRKNYPAPAGWIQDGQGNSTSDPFALQFGGALLPLGSDKEHGSHKGYCLGSVVDIFSAVLSGANFGPWVPPFVAFLNPPDDPVGEGIGHFFGAMRVDAFRPEEDFRLSMDVWINRFRNASRINQDVPVEIPGDQERNAENDRLINGIPLHQKVVDDLLNLAQKLNLDFPNPLTN
jgi:LDH2 family malate/lactate/ureidoglycolate dehydrogenase